VTDRYAVIGNPIAHSKSPRIHAAFAQSLGHDVRYEAILGQPGAFTAAVDAFRREGGRGMNVTVPFKVEAHAYATTLSERARDAGAVNTLAFDGDSVLGDNTDGAGLVADIVHRLRCPLAGKRVLLMGAGGAARGVTLPILNEHPSLLVIANRTLSKARLLEERFAPFGPVRAIGYGELGSRVFDVVVNATSASLGNEIPPVPTTVFAPGALAYDMVYGDQPTRFMQFALEAGAARAVDGLGMLVGQAAESYFLWRGVRPDTEPVVAMLRAST
jgi:shikimate dehydrogenase